MRIKFGNGKTIYGPGIDIYLSGQEVAIAIYAYLVARNIHIDGPRTILVNESLCENGRVYVDPSGSVVVKGKRMTGRGRVE